MQVKIKDEEQPKEFYPFTLEIRIESLEELANLWCRTNTGGDVVKENNKYRSQSELMSADSPSNTQLWIILNNKSKEFGISNY